LSCDWDVWCVTCGEAVTCFSDANHQVDMMRALVRHAPAIAAFATVFDDPQLDLRIETPWGCVVPRDFAEHADHELVPRDEYGQFDDGCGARFECSACASTHLTCVLKKGHDGAHAARRPAGNPGSR
jgi:hypothetical protein